MTRRIAAELSALTLAGFLASSPSPALAQMAGGSPPERQYAAQALRGIDKKDIRVVFLYDEDATPSRQVEPLVAATTVDAVAHGAKLTKADAARTPGSAPATPNSDVVLVSAAKQNAEACSQPGCVKSESGCFCFRLLDYDKVILSDIPSEDPEFTPPRDWTKGSATGGTGGRSASGPRTVVVVVGPSLQEKLGSADWWKRNRAWFMNEVWSKIQASPTATNVTIKIKSSPP